MYKILNSEPARLDSEALNMLETLGEVDNIDTDRKTLLEKIEQYDVLVMALQNTIDREVLEKSVKLKYIVTPTTGLSHIDVEATKEKGITIVSLKGETKFLESITATSELTWGLLISLVRKIPSAINSVNSGVWNRNLFYGVELREKTLGIVGLGRLGKKVAAYAKAFDMNVIFCDKKEIQTDLGHQTSLEELISESDFVCLHPDLNSKNHGLIDLELLKRMKNDAFLINTSRGKIINESDLLFALKNKLIAGAALDVVIDEDLPGDEWLESNELIDYAKENDNLLITPHIGGVTNDSTKKTNLFIVNKLKEVLGFTQ